MANVANEIREKLLLFVNPYTQKPVIKHVDNRTALGIASSDVHAPDLVVGYFTGARASWDTAVGATPKEVVNKRESKWSGEHLFDASEVPGVLFINKKISLKTIPSIVDIFPTILKIFTISPPETVDGRSLL